MRDAIVRFWPKADIAIAPHMSAFGGKADMVRAVPRSVGAELAIRYLLCKLGPSPPRLGKFSNALMRRLAVEVVILVPSLVPRLKIRAALILN